MKLDEIQLNKNIFCHLNLFHQKKDNYIVKTCLNFLLTNNIFLIKAINSNTSIS